MANAQQVKTESGDEVNLKKVDADVMASSAKALGIKVGKSATVAELVGALSGYFAAKEAKGEDSGNCSNCGITYTFDLDVCPACGTAADDGEEEEAEAEDSDSADSAGEEAPEPAKASPVEEPAAEEAPKRKKKAKPADVVRDDVVPKAAVVVSSKELDAQVAAVRAVMAEEAGAWAASHWKIGQKLKVIFDGSTWKQRMKDDGKTPAYKSWDKFITTEIGMHVATSYDVMRVAATFDEATVRRIGSSKCALILKAPEVEHQALVEKAEKGATKEEIRAEVNAARAKYGPPKSKLKTSKRTEKATKASDEKRRGRPVEKITVAQIVDAPHKVPLFAEASLKKGEDGSRKPVRARKFGEKPTGSLVLVNGVELHIRVAMTDKGAVAVVNFKRSE